MATTADLIGNAEGHVSTILRGLDKSSVVAQIARTTTTDATTLSFPLAVPEGDVAWVTEGAELSEYDARFDQIEVVPRKVGAVSSVTSEALDDAGTAFNADFADVLLTGLTGKIARAVDQAFFGEHQGIMPPGLRSVADVTTIQVDGAWENTDPFLAAISEAQGRRTEITAFAAHPSDALALSSVKRGVGSNESLLSPSAAEGGPATLIAGVPLVTSPFIEPGVIWGIPGEYCHMVVRREATIARSTDAQFSSDRVMFRATSRIGFGFTYPKAIQRIELVNGDDAAGEGS
ncbi:phage major capsid protein [Corynebacterium glyciniphilum]|uniref:phage major capsid protein n=1 Tax=Corynebacterium glyciniphilum TaxID=1404244 RepID=UPI00265234DA|nr:phage major capsid protein [Corynebacterium glyciniphilum]MDN6707403.1 phage major capsid protein [Corynebacterium glyciniphilum]